MVKIGHIFKRTLFLRVFSFTFRAHNLDNLPDNERVDIDKTWSLRLIHILVFVSALLFFIFR